jgi:hypothetical protein
MVTRQKIRMGLARDMSSYYLFTHSPGESVENPVTNALSSTSLILWCIQRVLKDTSPNYFVVIIRRCQMCIEHAGQKFDQSL